MARSSSPDAFECELGQGERFEVGKRSQLRRMAERGHYVRSSIHAILDEGYVCHLGYVHDGEPFVIPFAYARIGDSLYVHGALANAALKSACSSEPANVVCVSVTLVDGLVLSRAAFHHSVNYRCVVAFAHAHEVTETAEKREALISIVEHVLPGRSRDCRPPSHQELRSTRVIRLDIIEASAKVRTGGPKEDPDDLTLGVWAGVVPLSTHYGAPIPDHQGVIDVPVPAYIPRGNSDRAAAGGA